ncbi:sporulation protein [Paenisporosarcina cavernae]|uniref:Sporulation protein SpoOM n=1 Tax=Paenisporosarcina cavernae TaxID=2320858 RepID=A0A385YUV4_9BACL|nr:sporulation protein [Paenisporosarcina cavernae]AYC30334.1 sporulation protein SpoOM [Paenisporosarcina cavernae]
MSLFNKALASIGIGSAKIDTVLEKGSYTAGELVTGQVKVRGGNINQLVDSIFVSVYTTYVKEADDHKYNAKAAVKQYKVTEPFTILAGETKEFPITFTLPFDTPITIGNTRVWIQTEMDIKNAADPTDKDYIDVKPAPIAAAIINEVQNIGFRIRKVDCEHASHRFRGAYPFIQEVEFIPTSGPFRGKLDELEVMFISQSESHADIILQVDRKARGLGSLFSEALGTDESYVRMTVSSTDIPFLRTKLEQIISKHV